MKKSTYLVLALTLLGGCDANKSAAEYLAAAEELRKSGSAEVALVEVRNALQQEPENLQALLLAASLYEETSQWDALYASLQRVISMDPEHVEANVRLARLAVLAGNFAQAEVYAIAGMGDQPANTEQMALRAAVHLGQGEMSKALELANQAVEEDTGNVEALSILVVLALESNDLAGAHALLDGALAQNPQDQRLLLARMRVYAAQQDTAQMARVFDSLIAAAPEDISYRLSLSSLQMKSGDRAAADATLRAAMQAIPGNTKLKLAYASFVSEGEPVRAIEQLREFVEQAPEDTTLQLSLASSLNQLGRSDEAIDVYRSLTSNDVSAGVAVQARNEMAKIAVTKQEFARAGAIVSETLAADAGNPDALLLRAWLTLRKGEDMPAVLADAQRVLRDDPKNDRALVMLGQARAKEGSAALAKQRFVAATQINPQNLLGAKLLAGVYVEEQEYRKAAAALRPIAVAKRLDGDAARMLIQLELRLHNWMSAVALAKTYPVDRHRPVIAPLVEAAAARGNGRFEESIAILEPLLATQVSRPAALIGTVQSFNTADQAKRAVTFLNSQRVEHPNDLLLAELLASQLIRVGDKSGAKTLWKETLVTSPGWERGVMGYVDQLVKEQAYAEALVVSKQFLLGNQSDEVSLRLALLAEQIGDRDLAIQTYEQLLDAEDASDMVRNNLAVLISEDEKQLDRAFQIASPLQHSAQPAFLDTLGWLNHQMGNNERALKLLDQAVALAPDIAEIRYHLGATLASMNQNSRAKMELTRALGATDAEQPLLWQRDAAELLKRWSE